MASTEAVVTSPTIDTFDLARWRWHLEGDVEVRRMPRLAESLSNSDGVLHYRIDGLIDDNGHPGADLRLHARLQLVCQRCNGMLEFALDRTTRFRFVANEQELNALPIQDDEIDAIIGSHTFNLYEWIEEEAILSLPLVPRHDECSLPTLQSDDTNTAARPNPFAVLTELKNAGNGERH